MSTSEHLGPGHETDLGRILREIAEALLKIAANLRSQEKGGTSE